MPTAQEKPSALLADANLDDLERLRCVDPRLLHEQLKASGLVKLGQRLRVEAFLRVRSEQQSQQHADQLHRTPPDAADPIAPLPPSPSAQSAPSPGAPAPAAPPPAPRQPPPPEDSDLSAEQCESLLRELLRRYAEPSFKSQLVEAQHSMDLAKLGPLVLRVQASATDCLPTASGLLLASGVPPACLP